MPKYCTECGAKLEGNPKFCPKCGEKLLAEEIIQKEETIEKSYGPNTNRIGETSDTWNKKQDKTKIKNKKIIIGVAFLILMAIVIGFVLSNNNQPQRLNLPQRELVVVYDQDYTPLQSFKFSVSGHPVGLYINVIPISGNDFRDPTLYEYYNGNPIYFASVSSDSYEIYVQDDHEYELKMSDNYGHLIVQYYEQLALHPIRAVITKLN